MGLIEGMKDWLKDLLDVNLLPIKITYFLLLSSIVVIWPQLTLHQQELGLTAYQTGICSYAMSAVIIIVPFLCGFVGDKLGNFKVLLCAVTALSGVLAFPFTLVPSARLTSNSSDLNSNVSLVQNTTTNFSLEHDQNDTEMSIKSPEVDPDKLVLTFWIYLTVRVAFGMVQAVSFSLFEALVMAHMQKNNVNFGYQRAWGTLGVIASSYLSGVLSADGYRNIFYVSAALYVVTAVLMSLLRLEFKLPANTLTRDIFRYLRNPEVILFFSAMLFAGMFIGYIETFMYRFLAALGATPMLIGLTVTVGAPFEIVLTLITTVCVRRVGYVSLIVMGLAAYSVRMIGFSLLTNPWWVLPLEAFESVANGLMFTSAIMYCGELFPIHTIATFRGIFGATYFGVGKLFGTLVGSEIREALGDRRTFQVLAAVALISAILYGVSFCLLKRKKSGSGNLSSQNPSKMISSTPSPEKGIDNKAWEGSQEYLQ